MNEMAPAPYRPLPPAVHALRPLAMRLLRVTVAAAVLVSITSAMSGYRHALAGRLEHLHFGWLSACVALCIAYRVVNAFGWVMILRALGHPMRIASGTRIWLVSETMRWLPGSVWSFFSRVAQAKAAGVPAVTASLSLLVELLLTIAAWGVVAATGVGLSGAAITWLSKIPALWMAASIVALSVVIAAPFVLARVRPSTRISKKLHGLFESLRELRNARPRIAHLAATFAFFTVLCFLNGVAFFAVLASTSDTLPNLLATIGINATGWLLGFFAFFAPAGLGVREGGMTAMLAPLMPIDAAVIGVLLWRFVQIIVELLCLAACLAPNAALALRRRANAMRQADVRSP